MTTSRAPYFFATVVLTVMVAGCGTNPPTASDLMRGQAADAQSEVDLRNTLAADWDRGVKLARTGERRVTDGQGLIASAERDLERGRNQVDQGQGEISEGSRLVQESERHFRESSPGIVLPGDNH